MPLSRGEFGEPVSDRVLKIKIVGIQIHGLAGELFELCREDEKE